MRRIAIHSVPRSGSTWLGSIFDSSPEVIYKYQPLFSYALKSYLSPNSTYEEILEFFNKLTNMQDDFLDQKEAKSKGIVPNFKKSIFTTVVYKEVRYHNIIENLLKKDREIKVIGLVRNPLNVISSWYNAPREFRRDLGWEIENEWESAQSKNQDKPEEFYGFNKWIEVTILFEKLKKEYPQNFYLIKYENLLHQPEKAVKQIFDFVGLGVSDQTKFFLRESRAKNISNEYSVYKNKNIDEGWKQTLPNNIAKIILKSVKKNNLKEYL